jgi:CheY-like chemotaxis protein
LRLVHKLIDLHGGSLAVAAVTSGNRFTLQLPDHDDESPASSRSSWQNLFIVVIDPCAAMARSVAPFLLDRGHRVFIATSYEQGVRFVTQYRPDVVVVDVRAEDPRALDAVREIRALEEADLAATPIVASCGLLLPGYPERCSAAGVTEYFERPLRSRHMAAIVEEHGPYAKAC